MTDDQLLYATITGMVPNDNNSVTILFKYATSSKTTDHIYSRDKDKYPHCYHQLEVGQTYIIVENKVKPGRWVWKVARLVTVKQAQQFAKMAGIHPTDEQFTTALNWLNDIQRPKKPEIPPTLADLLIF